uniref:Uncharacterized protein n=1 Tax=Vitis vinifera TaxID=29760 RepID=F6HB84_VITVI
MQFSLIIVEDNLPIYKEKDSLPPISRETAMIS